MKFNLIRLIFRSYFSDKLCLDTHVISIFLVVSVLSISGSLVSGWVAQDAYRLMVEPKQANGAYAHDVMEAILVSKNTEMAAMLLFNCWEFNSFLM